MNPEAPKPGETPIASPNRAVTPDPVVPAAASMPGVEELQVPKRGITIPETPPDPSQANADLEADLDPNRLAGLMNVSSVRSADEAPDPNSPQAAEGAVLDMPAPVGRIAAFRRMLARVVSGLRSGTAPADDARELAALMLPKEGEEHEIVKPPTRRENKISALVKDISSGLDLKGLNAESQLLTHQVMQGIDEKVEGLLTQHKQNLEKLKEDKSENLDAEVKKAEKALIKKLEDIQRNKPEIIELIKYKQSISESIDILSHKVIYVRERCDSLVRDSILRNTSPTVTGFRETASNAEEVCNYFSVDRLVALAVDAKKIPVKQMRSAYADRAEEVEKKLNSCSLGFDSIENKYYQTSFNNVIARVTGTLKFSPGSSNLQNNPIHAGVVARCEKELDGLRLEAEEQLSSRVTYSETRLKTEALKLAIEDPRTNEISTRYIEIVETRNRLEGAISDTLRVAHNSFSPEISKDVPENSPEGTLSAFHKLEKLFLDDVERSRQAHKVNDFEGGSVKELEMLNLFSNVVSNLNASYLRVVRSENDRYSLHEGNVQYFDGQSEYHPAIAKDIKTRYEAEYEKITAALSFDPNKVDSNTLANYEEKLEVCSRELKSLQENLVTLDRFSRTRQTEISDALTFLDTCREIPSNRDPEAPGCKEQLTNWLHAEVQGLKDLISASTKYDGIRDTVAGQAAIMEEFLKDDNLGCLIDRFKNVVSGINELAKIDRDITLEFTKVEVNKFKTYAARPVQIAVEAQLTYRDEAQKQDFDRIMDVADDFFQRVVKYSDDVTWKVSYTQGYQPKRKIKTKAKS